MKCSECFHYSRQLSRCRKGKIKPYTIKSGADAVEFFGITYICRHSPLFEKIKNELNKRKEKPNEQTLCN